MSVVVTGGMVLKGEECMYVCMYVKYGRSVKDVRDRSRCFWSGVENYARLLCKE